MVFGHGRDLLQVARAFMEFFVDESCGYCTPCRVGNRLLLRGLEKVLAGHGRDGDLAELESLANSVKVASRCGLGQTSPHPILSTLKNFRPEYERRLQPDSDKRNPTFDIERAVSEAERIIGRRSIHHTA
jgi:[NiFe] hydrogenase diaphorase moiety large subunit